MFNYIKKIFGLEDSRRVATICIFCENCIINERDSSLNKCKIPKKIRLNYNTGAWDTITYCDLLNRGNCKYFNPIGIQSEAS